SPKLARAYRAIVVLAVVALSASAFAAWCWTGRGGVGSAVFDEEVRRAATLELVARGSGVWDTFPDATVARVLQPGLRGRGCDPFTADSNELGLRERAFELRKPAGVTRVVILGDSFVMGYGVPASDRVGVFLEKLLRDHSHGATGAIECLHFGVM